MGTHCYIGVQEDDGAITFSYCHYDGYPDGVGKQLVEMEFDEAMAVAEFGDMRAIGESINHPESSRMADDVNEYKDEIESGPVEYAYLLNAVGDWLVYFVHGARAGAWVDLREELGMAPKECKDEPDPGRVDSTGGTDPMQTNDVIGFCIRNHETGELIANDPATGRNFCTFEEVPAIARGDAFRRLAGFLDQNPDADPYDFGIETVYRQTTPIEDAASELGGLFESLCKRHGLDFGLSREQINGQLVKDLEAVRDGRGFGPAAFGVPGNGRR